MSSQTGQAVSAWPHYIIVLIYNTINGKLKVVFYVIKKDKVMKIMTGLCNQCNDIRKLEERSGTNHLLNIACILLCFIFIPVIGIVIGSIWLLVYLLVIIFGSNKVNCSTCGTNNIVYNKLNKMEKIESYCFNCKEIKKHYIFKSGIIRHMSILTSFNKFEELKDYKNNISSCDKYCITCLKNKREDI